MVKQSLQIPIVDELYNVKNSFYSNLMSEYFNLYDFSYNSLSGNIKQLFLEPDDSAPKLSFYHSIKQNYSPSAYLDSTRQKSFRRALVKLRIGCHNLRVE